MREQGDRKEGRDVDDFIQVSVSHLLSKVSYDCYFVFHSDPDCRARQTHLQHHRLIKGLMVLMEGLDTKKERMMIDEQYNNTFFFCPLNTCKNSRKQRRIYKYIYIYIYIYKKERERESLY